MKLDRVSIRNFRNLREVDIYPVKTTVLIGENNTGKSNLLYALRLLFDPQAERLRLDLSEDDINDAARAEGETYFSIMVKIGDLQKHQAVEVCFKERIDRDGDETFVIIEGRFEPDDDGIYTWQSLVLPPQERVNDPIPMSRRMARAIPLYFLDAVRDAAHDTRATGRGLLSRLLDNVDYTDVQVETQGYLREANAALNKGREISSLAGGLTNELTSLVPGGQSEVAIAVADEDVSHLTRNFRLNIRRGPDLPQSDISRHGTGLQDLTLIAMFRHAVASEEKGKPILAIEEPGAHLHPHVQRRLFKDLSEIDAPVLLTNHSPAIVKYADPSSLILLRSDARNETTAYQLDTEEIGDDDLKDLAQLMRGGRAEMFFARSIIIVEGQSELIALPHFAEILGCDLDRDGISLVQANGNSYAFILRACQRDQFAIHAVVTYDTDVLKHDNKLLKEAKRASLIDEATCQSCRRKTPSVTSDRKQVLDNIGWIGAVTCFEEEVCRAEYLDVVIQAIKDADPEHQSHSTALDRYLQEEGLNKDAWGVAQFVSKKRKTLKIPVAHAVADAVKTVGLVPDCYARAIRQAIVVSMGGIPVDEYFERRACEAGFLDVILEKIKLEGADTALEQFLNNKEVAKGTIGVARFLTESQVGKGLRDKVKDIVADAVEAAGCKEYAESIRQSDSLVISHG
jgi:putative ATP-dependent endonuclease of the OLD family